MTDIVKFTVQGHDVQFLCKSRNTRNGFAHDAEMYLDDNWMADYTCHYYNRTWECWRYQSVCFGCVRRTIWFREQWPKKEYKRLNGLSRISGDKHKAGLKEMAENDSLMQLFNAILKELDKRRF